MQPMSALYFIKRTDWLHAASVRKQPIIALYFEFETTCLQATNHCAFFEFETVFKFHNLDVCSTPNLDKVFYE